MFFSTTSLATLLALPFFVSALTITGPSSSGWKENGTVTATWTTDSGDPEIFTILLQDTQTPSVINPFAIANSVNASLGTVSFVLPPIPIAQTYQIKFINVTDVNNVYATSSTFSIAVGPATSTSASASSASSTSTTSSSSASSASATAPGEMNAALSSFGSNGNLMGVTVGLTTAVFAAWGFA